MCNFSVSTLYVRGGKWSFKDQGSRKIFVEFHGLSLIFPQLCAPHSLD